MSKVTAKWTVFFEEPFWVGLFQREEDGRLSVCKVTFGAEPKDGQLWEFLLKSWHRLEFSPAVEAALKKESANPKRIRREARKQTRPAGMGTKSQQALQAQREQMKTRRKAAAKEQRRAERERRYALKQEKRRRKHQGR